MLKHPEREMDYRFLEASRDRAVMLLDSHHSRRESWIASEVISPQLLGEMALLHSDYEQLKILDDDLKAAVKTFLLTEDAVVYYPRDVGFIFNPDGVIGDDSNPHEAFTRTWSAEEFHHTIAGLRVAELLGLDLSDIEKDRVTFITKGIVPQPRSTLLGTAYTSLQESSTAAPYRELMLAFRKLAQTTGIPKVAEALEASAVTYEKTAQDERLHRTFIAGCVNAALESGDKELASAMLEALAFAYVDERFAMPGEQMPDFARNSVRIRRAGIFTAEHVVKAKVHLLKNTWNVTDIEGLTGSGLEAQQKLGKFILDNSA
jgi:hypothetical protein